MRTILVLGFGAVLGASASYYFASADPAAEPAARAAIQVALLGATAASLGSSGPARSSAQDDVGLEALLGAPLGIAERAAIYGLAARSDTRALGALIRTVATLPASDSRDFARAVLLTGYAEIDAAEAIDLARNLDLPVSALAPLYQTWARASSTQALASLRDIDDAAEAHTIALALLDVLGNDDLGVARVTATFTPNAADDLAIAAIAAQAERSPQEALQRALALNPLLSSLAVERIAEIWARQDARDALAQLTAIDDPALQSAFRAAVLGRWAREQPDAMLAYVATLDPAAQRDFLFGGGLQQLARSSPERAFELAAQLPAELRTALEQTALQQLAQRDPLAALERWAQLPPGMQRQSLAQAVARGYGQRDPEAALAWAQSLRPAEPRVLAGVIGGIAQVDWQRALDLALGLTSQGEQMQALQMVAANGATRSNADNAALAERLLALPNGGNTMMLMPQMFGTWAGRDPDAATEWLLASGDRVPPQVFAMVAEQLARRGDPLSLAAYTDRVPREARGAWIGAVAQAYARTDAQAALNWVEQFRGDTAYGAAAARTAQVLAQNDPVAAARLLGTLEQKSPEARSTARGVAFGWAQQDPPRATEWALNLSDAEMRTNAVQAVAQSWASRDTASARGWALSLPNGGTRDAALHAIVGSLAATSTPDQAVLTAFSTEADRQQALRTSLMRIAQRSEAEARQFINGHFTDSAAREQAEQLLETARQRPVMVSPSGFPFGPAVNLTFR